MSSLRSLSLTFLLVSVFAAKLRLCCFGYSLTFLLAKQLLFIR